MFLLFYTQIWIVSFYKAKTVEIMIVFYSYGTIIMFREIVDNGV